MHHHIDPEYYYDNDTDEIVFYLSVARWIVPYYRYDGVQDGRVLYTGFRFDPVTPPANKEIIRYEVEGIEFFVDGKDFMHWCSPMVFYPEHNDPNLVVTPLNLDPDGKYFMTCGGNGLRDEWRFEESMAVPVTGSAKVTVFLKSKNKNK